MNKFCKYMPSSKFPETKGSALQLGIAEYKREGKKDKTVVMVEMCLQSKQKPQTGSTDSAFDWTQKQFMSLKDLEIAGIMAVIQGRIAEYRIIHKHPIDGPDEQQKVSSLDVKLNEWKGAENLLINFSQRKPGEKEFSRVSIALQPEEIIIVRILLEGAIKRIYSVS